MLQSPEPLTPPDCDLRDFAFMPLDVLRVRDSDFAAIDDPEAFRCGWLLWCASWHQLPAASLPNDASKLARLAGYGRDVATFEAARGAGGMRGWVLCSDGRLYHPVVAEKALEAWEAKKKQRARTAKATQARLSAAKATGNKGNGSNVTSISTKHVTPNATSDATIDVTITKGQVQGQVRDSTTQEVDSSRTAAREKREVKPPDMPKVGDPPDRWLVLSEKSEIDEKMVRHAVAGGYYLDQAAEMTLEAAKINPARFRGDWQPLIEWLESGHELPAILAAIGAQAARPGYDSTRISSLKYFDGAVRDRKGTAK